MACVFTDFGEIIIKAIYYLRLISNIYAIIIELQALSVKQLYIYISVYIYICIYIYNNMFTILHNVVLYYMFLCSL